ncbi:zonular occludens toxin domain-containing protein [Neisseria musculi]|uniref:Zonular occludens toxin family protein n=1 Tax=Neisseria musculi TaxID=1815583 RepID=A0A7H1MA79_9NEIS|nr:zonular occludens toxin domain-containing protein [Neisseria musculi]QNT58544.1 zonular occludens toxin family protein [Neisseria musculi]
MAAITLITGKPRIGKTAFAVELLMFDDFYKGRKIFSNINGLEIEHHKPPEGHSWEDMHVWLKWKENIGSVVIYDEVQYLYPTRSNGSKMPENVAFLNVHGHYGIDMILITQSPKIIDINLREVVNKHIHIAANKMGGLTRLEWNEVATNPTAQSRNALSSSHKIRQEVFNYYKSAEVHTRHKHIKSRWYYVIIAMLLILPCILGLVGFMGYKMYKGYQEKAGGVVENVTEKAASDVITGNLIPQNALPQVQQGRSLSPDMFVPTLAEKPESKPLYDGVRQVKTYERIAACISGGKSGCTCYSDQATQLKEVTAEMCKDYVKNGLPFNPYKDTATVPYTSSETAQGVSPAPGGEVLVMGGKSPPNLMYDGYVEAGEQFRP